MGGELGENGKTRRHRGRIVGAVIVAVLIVGIAFFSYSEWDRSQLKGEVSAEELSVAFFTSACEARPLYDGRLWTISGTVTPNNRMGRVFTLAGGSHAIMWSGCIRNFASRVDTQNVVLSWDEASDPVPQVGEVIRVTCRIKLEGFGLTFPAHVSGKECRSA
jgi:hypothetical protein